MSISQHLVKSLHDFDLFAPSWQAGLSGSQCLKKSLKNYDIEKINIGETCENLRLALNESSKYKYESMSQVSNGEKQCAIRKSNIPFRACSNIWFGTLKIYQQQVNSLLRLSRDLFSRSSTYNVKQLEANKRKSSVTSNKLIKKRRLTLSESNKKTYFTTNYSELLDDLERLAQEPLERSLAEFSQTLNGTVTQIQVREITIREISATTYTTPSDLLDEDSGFGEATHEEITEFFNFAGDNFMSNSKGTPTKRKSTCGQASPLKKRCNINDFEFEPLNNENVSMPEGISSKTSLKRSITPTHITKYLVGEKFEENKNLLETNNVDNKDIIINDDIKKENFSDAYNYCAKKKKNNLIIDECTKIDISEIIEEIKRCKVTRKISRKNMLKSYKSKRNKTALELLTSFNRRSFKLSFYHKKKCYLSREQFERDYLNLVREIFNINYNEKWPSEIYPKWKYFKDVHQKQYKKQIIIKSKKKKLAKQTEEADAINTAEVYNRNVMEDSYFNDYQQALTINNCNMEKFNSNNDWRPLGVMEKLLNLWRFNETNEIAAKILFKLAVNQIERALGFNSLLNLSKKQFITLTTFPKSIELQNVSMGKFVKSNITSDFT